MILPLDANKDRRNGNLGQAIISEPKQKMKDLVIERKRKDGPGT